MASEKDSHDFLYIMAFITMIASCDTCSKVERVESEVRNMNEKIESIDKKLKSRPIVLDTSRFQRDTRTDADTIK